MLNYVDYEDDLHERLKDPEHAIGYLNACLEDDDVGTFLLAMRDVAKVHGGLQTLAKKAGLNREHLFRMLAEGGNPTLSSLSQLLHAMGLKLVLKHA